MKLVVTEPIASVISIESYRRKRPEGINYCPHRAVAIDEGDRVLTCQTCKADVDPFAYIAWLARNWDAATMAIEAQKTMTAKVRAETEALKAELASLKGKVRRARAKATTEGT